jgi:hypothetical protein
MHTKKVSGLKVFRYYILKPNGKWRPIGAPAPVTKMIHTALDLILRVAFERYVPS